MKIDKYRVLVKDSESKYRLTLDNNIIFILHTYKTGYPPTYFWISDKQIDRIKDMVGLPEEELQNMASGKFNLKLLLKYNIITEEEYLTILLLIKQE